MWTAAIEKDAQRLKKQDWPDRAWTFEIQFENEPAHFGGFWSEKQKAEESRQYLIDDWANATFLRPPFLGPIIEISLLRWLTGPNAQFYIDQNGQAWET